MEYKIEKKVISDLISLYEGKKLNLNPPYQRNDIWPPLSKKRLIESVKKGYPLPSFFLHKKSDNTYDMVDGQQRTRTFIGYKKGFFPDTEKNFFDKQLDWIFRTIVYQLFRGKGYQFLRSKVYQFNEVVFYVFSAKYHQLD